MTTSRSDHPILRKIQAYLEDYSSRSKGMPESLIDDACKELKSILNKQFNDDRNDEFTLRMSNVGRPQCQLLAEYNNWPKEPFSYAHKNKMVIGDIVEIALVAIMKAAGVNIQEEHTRVQLDLSGEKINGTLDVIIDGALYDIKSASPWAYENKFAKGYEELVKDDTFGYVGQLVSYAEAKGVALGGFIVVNKSTGEVCVCEVPDTPEVRNKALDFAEDNVNAVTTNRPFVRSFEDQAETHYRKETGNRVLGINCSFCPFRFRCWPGLQHLPSLVSKAKNPPWKYYTHIEQMNEDEKKEWEKWKI